MSKSSRSSRAKLETNSSWAWETKKLPSKSQKEQNKPKKVCRVCLLYTAQVNIFNCNMGEGLVHKIIMTISNVQIEEGDGLPTDICKGCLKSLKAAYRFKTQCEATDRMLRQTSNCPTIEKNIEYVKQENSQGYGNDPLCIESETYSQGDTSTSYESQSGPATRSNMNYIKQESEHEIQHFQNDNLQNYEIPPQQTQNPTTSHTAPQQTTMKCLKEVCRQANTAPAIPITIIEQPLIKKTKARKNATCAVCYQKFENYEDYQAHVRTHNGEVEKPYKCKECSKGFLCVSQLNRHLFTHSDVKLYECPVCKRGFNNASHMKSHMYIHTGEKPYSCNICKKKFNQMPHLKRHMISHENEREMGIMDLSTFPMD